MLLGSSSYPPAWKNKQPLEKRDSGLNRGSADRTGEEENRVLLCVLIGVDTFNHNRSTSIGICFIPSNQD
jgi:hypothetical protein